MSGSTSAQHELPNPPSDAVSSVRFSRTGQQLLVSSWDRHVYLYNISSGDGSELVRSYEHRAPVLDLAWGSDDSTAYTVGLDWDVRQLDLATGEQVVLSTHKAEASRVVYSPKHQLLISASWDRTLHVHKFVGSTPDRTSSDGSEPQNPKLIAVPLPAKPFALALSPSKLVVAMSGRATSIWDLSALDLVTRQASDPAEPSANRETGGRIEVEVAPWQRRDSSLKYMTRAVACMPDDRGYATSSIEGRVAVEWFADDKETQERKYAFKCHRQAGTGEDEGVDVVYPVNALAFHPKFGTFASGGGDGVVSVWDAAAKKRIRNYAKLGASVAGLDWSHDGKWLAVGVSPGFEDGKEYPPDEPGGMVVKVLVRELAEGEAKAKAK